MIKRLALTTGEPAGIGPDLAVMLAQSAHPHEIIYLGCPHLLTERAQALALPVTIQTLTNETLVASTPKSNEAGLMKVLATDCSNTVKAGQLDAANAPYVLTLLDNAVSGCLSGIFDGMVTAPVQKSIINDAGIAFSGHTEYLAQKTNVQQVVMMLASSELKVALATTHLPLKDVATHITKPLLTSVCEILTADLRKFFGIESPVILIAGLNPHAGESGHLGLEEIDVITPVVKALNQQDFHLIGPLPADTLFTQKYLAQADAVLAMYHDQGLPVLKYQSFGHAANITLGLPIIRTSVDHGTALDLAATGRAETGSLTTAIDMAVNMCCHHRQ